MRLLFGSNTNPVYRAALSTRIMCWLDGGHHLYFNTELGGLWCYRCGCGWECDPPIDMRGKTEAI